MKRLIQAAALLAWLCVATYLYAVAWSRYPAFFPHYPEWVADAIGRWTTDPRIDDVESLATNYYLILSFAAVSVATLVGIVTWRLLRRRHKRDR